MLRVYAPVVFTLPVVLHHLHTLISALCRTLWMSVFILYCFLWQSWL